MNSTKSRRFRTVVYLPSVQPRTDPLPKPKEKPKPKARPKRLSVEFTSCKLSQTTLALDFLHKQHQSMRQARLSFLKESSSRTRPSCPAKQTAVTPRQISLDIAEESASDFSQLVTMKKYYERKSQRYASLTEGAETYMINEYALPNALVSDRSYKRTGRRPGRNETVIAVLQRRGNAVSNHYFT